MSGPPRKDAAPDTRVATEAECAGNERSLPQTGNDDNESTVSTSTTGGTATTTDSGGTAALTDALVPITLGRGQHANTGYSRTVTAAELPGVLAGHRGPEAWTILADLAGGRRRKIDWRNTGAITGDIDHPNKRQPTATERTMLASVAASLGATLWHDTPHGLRAVFVLRDRCAELSRVEAAAAHLCDRVDDALAGSEFRADRGATSNVVQPMWAPCAIVGGVQRSADVIVSGSLHRIDDLLPPGWKPPVPSSDDDDRAEACARVRQMLNDGPDDADLGDARQQLTEDLVRAQFGGIL